jgi:S1-C subfamily serine protease
VNSDLASADNLPVSHGALVQEVAPGGPADRAGLHAGKIHTDQGVILGGDVIVRVDGERVSKPDDVAAAINDNRPGDTVAVEFYRDNKLVTKRVKLSTRPAALDNSASGGTDQGTGGTNLLP